MATEVYGESRLERCPDSPNCVSSLSQVARHQINPFRLRAEPGAAWTRLREMVAAWSRTTIVEEDKNYLKAEARSRLFRFVDDVVFELDAGHGVVNVRSASRAGYWDLGVNHRRIEAFRSALMERGLVAPS